MLAGENKVRRLRDRAREKSSSGNQALNILGEQSYEPV